MKVLLFALLTLPALALAQTSVPTDFPPDAVVLTDQGLQQRKAGKVFRATLANGQTWRLEYKANDYVFLNTGSGHADNGKWSAQGGQLCIEWNRSPSGCSETRATADAVYVKRSSTGEVVAMRPE